MMISAAMDYAMICWLKKSFVAAGNYAVISRLKKDM